MLPKVIIDTDIGDDIDDSFALLLGVLSKKMDILGITTCFRNAKKRAKIARALLDSIDSNIEVYPGEDLPMSGPVLYADFDKFDVNNEVIMSYYFTEMSDLQINNKYAIDFMIETINKYPNEVSVISLGPLTNLAKLKEIDIKAFNKIKSITFMGGQTETDFKEWNVRCDIHAANQVFQGKVPIKCIGLNVTSKCKLTQASLNALMKTNQNSFGPLLKKMVKAYMDFFDGERLPIMHDPLTIACVIGDFCEYKRCKVDIAVCGDQAGQTIINPNSNNLEILVASKVHKKKFMDYLSKILMIKL